MDECRFRIECRIRIPLGWPCDTSAGFRRRQDGNWCLPEQCTFRPVLIPIRLGQQRAYPVDNQSVSGVSFEGKAIVLLTTASITSVVTTCWHVTSTEAACRAWQPGHNDEPRPASGRGSSL